MYFERKEYLFPFKSVEPDSKIILYGAGLMGQDFYRQCLFSQYCEVIHWVDSNHYVHAAEGYPVFSPESLMDYVDQCDYILISILSTGACNQVCKWMIEQGIPKEKIIFGFQEMPCLMELQYKKRFSLPNPNNTLIHKMVSEESKKSLGAKKKIEVRCFFWVRYAWNIIYSVYREFAKDERYHVKLIGVEKQSEDVILWSEYDMTKDQMDIVIYTLFDFEYAYSGLAINLYDDLERLNHISPKPLIAVIPSGILNMYDTTEEMAATIIPGLERYQVDYCFVDKLVYKDLETAGYCNNSKVREFGNPKFDRVYEKVSGEVYYPKNWEKLKNKKVFLITTDHNWNYPDVTVDLYFQTYIEYFSNHPELGLILRPHPAYEGELQAMHLLSRREINEIKNFFAASDNMVYDDFSDYGIAYKLADFVVADVNCGIMFSALPMGKPMCVPHRFDGRKLRILYEKYLDAYYNYRTPEECVNVFNLLVSGEDPLKEERAQLEKEVFMHFDGKNGQRIKMFLEEKYEERNR